jgi:hypothetical protein
LLNNDMLGFRRHALTFLPDSTNAYGRLLCLRHNRVACMWWTFVSGCVQCRNHFRERLRPRTGCLAPAVTCSCNICRRQPPTLRDMSSQVLFTMSCNLDLFELTRDVTHEQYVYANTSGQTGVLGVLPHRLP